MAQETESMAQDTERVASGGNEQGQGEDAVGNTYDTMPGISKEDVDDDGPWYMASDGSYFQERRVPFFTFNLLAYCATMGVFVWMAVSITNDYIQQQTNPPTTTLLRQGLDQKLPGVLVCNQDYGTLFSFAEAFYTNQVSATDEPEQNITDQLKFVPCEPSCMYLDAELPAFAREKNDDGGESCVGINSIWLALEIDASSYFNSTLFLGADMYLFQPGNGDNFVDAFCNIAVPRCRSLASGFGTCSENISSLTFDFTPVTSAIGTVVDLSTSQTENSPSCRVDTQSFNPTVTNLAFNPAALEYYFGDNISQVDPNNLIAVSIQFRDSRISETSFTPISAQSMFGSLSGWFGFLTDGWGVISILYAVERTLLYLINQNRR